VVAQLVKGLKPKKLKIKEVRLNILNALRAEGKVVKAELEKTTTTWKGAKPTFTIAIGLTGQDAIVLIGPAGSAKGAQKWGWLDEGTEAHIIKAKNVPNVKTFSSGAGSISPPWRKAKQVKHPGIDAREWSEEIVKRRKKPFTKAILKAARV
jgi:hypothetical protein